MTDFNQKLQAEGNNTIRRAEDFAGELNFLPVPLPVVKCSLELPFGVEYINANSKTVHTIGTTSATVNWSLPVIGGHISPTIVIRPGKTNIYLQPIIGYYMLGKVFRADLSVTDRPGSSEADARAIGGLFLIGVEHPFKGWSVLAEGGYRWLSFDNVSLTPKNGFTVAAGGTVVQPGNLPQTLDYSGFLVRFGLGYRF